MTCTVAGADPEFVVIPKICDPRELDAFKLVEIADLPCLVHVGCSNGQLTVMSDSRSVLTIGDFVRRTNNIDQSRRGRHANVIGLI